MGRNPDIAYLILRLLAECGCISRRGFDMLNYHYVNVSINLKKLVDMWAIQLSGKGAGKYYTLLDPGWKMLMAFNPERYHAGVRPNRAILKRHPERSMRKGDVAAAFYLADYPVHPDCKPALAAAYLPDEPIEPGGSARSVHYNDIIEYPETADKEVYNLHHLPYDCYYQSHEIKDYVADQNKTGLNYSRACGVALHHDQALRVYHSGDTAMELMQTGEKKLQALLPRVFADCPATDYEGALVFGSGFLAAEKILANTMGVYKAANKLRKIENKKIEKGEKKKGEFLSATNTGDPLYYLPVQKESVAFLRLIRYNDWRGWLRRWTIGMIQKWPQQFEVFENPNHLFIGQYEGRIYYQGIPMDLALLVRFLHHLEKGTNRPVTMFCLEWQLSFYESVLREYVAHNMDAIQFKVIDQAAFEDFEDDAWCHWA